MTHSNIYLASEQADSALVIEQMPQFADVTGELLSKLKMTVSRMAANQVIGQKQIVEDHSTGLKTDPAEDFAAATALISQLEEVLTQLPEITQKLNRAHALLTAQREASMDGILVVDESNRITSINQKFCDFWRVPAALQAVRDDRKMLAHAINQTANPEQFLEKVTYLYEHPHESSQDELLLKDGRIGGRYSVPVISSEGEHFGRVWYFRDITQQKRAELTLKEMNEALEAQVKERTQALEQGMSDLQNLQSQLVQSEKMVALGNLVSGVAHEVNNPVGFIAGNVKPALEYIQDLFTLIDLYETHQPAEHPEIASQIEDMDLDYIKEDLPKLVSSIRTGARRIKEISTSLRTFSRADTDTPVHFNIHDGLDSTLLILKHRIKANDNRDEISIVKRYSELPNIECYAGQLNQVFMNLLANAIDAVDEAHPQAAQIEIETVLLPIDSNNDTDQQISISIKDNGIGMSEAVKQQVFEHLFTTKAVGKGTGLGLAIARQIIFDRHKGRIDIKSAPGEGTEFLITLPVKSPESNRALLAT